MIEKVSYIYSIISLIMLCIITSVVCAGCDPDEKTDIQFDALSDAKLMPITMLTTESGTNSVIKIISADVSVDFPNSLNFSLEAESSQTIIDVKFLYTTHRILRPSVNVTVKPGLQPDTYINVDWTWDTRKASLPPGAEIEYQWIITDATGKVLETTSSTLEFADDNYEWKELESDWIRLYWYHGDETFGNELMEAAQQGLSTLFQDTNSEPIKQIRIYVYSGTDDLHNALIYPVEWTGGLAFTEHGIIALGIRPSNLDWGKRAIKHELSHMVIYQVTYSPLSYVPLWLDEGLAMYSEGDLLGNFESRLEDAISNDTLFSIKGIGGGFPTATDRAELAYAQSHSLVNYLISNFGSSKMQNLLNEFSAGTSLDDALVIVYGFESEKLETDWRDSLL